MVWALARNSILFVSPGRRICSRPIQSTNSEWSSNMRISTLFGWAMSKWPSRPQCILTAPIPITQIQFSTIWIISATSTLSKRFRSNYGNTEDLTIWEGKKLVHGHQGRTKLTTLSAERLRVKDFTWLVWRTKNINIIKNIRTNNITTRSIASTTRNLIEYSWFHR